MAGRSSIERDPEVRAAVDQALSKGATIDEIVAKLRELGAGTSRSAVGRYAQDYRALADQQRDMQAVAKAFGNEFGSAGDNQGRMLVQLGTTILTKFAMSSAGAEVDFSTKELMEFGKAVQSVTSAAKIDADRDAKVREEVRKEERLRAAELAVGDARSAGASDESIARIRAKFLGIAA